MTLDLIAIRRDLHRHPETAFEEHRTAGVVEAHLRALGLQTRRCAGTGVIAEIEGAAPGPTIALRADMDALPIQEQADCAFPSLTPGKMHACGHDAHTAILLGAAEKLVQDRAAIAGRVRLLFQPAEETTQGAPAMMKEGALDGVEAIYGLHNDPQMPVGRAAFRTGPMMASSDRIRITVTGVGGHAAFPHNTADPLIAAAGVLSGLQTAVSRAINPLDPVVVSICVLQGGTTFNVIPSTVYMEGTVRCFSAKVRDEMEGLLGTIASNIAAGYRCSAKLHYERMAPAVNNDPAATALARCVAGQVLGEAHVVDAEPVMGAEDFAAYQEMVPGCFLWLGSQGPHGLHHPGFTLDEGCIPVGAELLYRIALKGR